jgi:hypothetical protein
MSRDLDSITTTYDAREFIERIAQNYDPRHVDELAGLSEEQAESYREHQLNSIAMLKV